MKPKITEGIPAIISINNNMNFETFLCELNARNNAHPALKGVAIAVASNEIYMVASIMGRNEYSGLGLRGLHALPKRNSGKVTVLKKSRLSLRI